MRKKNKLAVSLKGVTKKYAWHYDKPTLVELLLRRKVTSSFIALDDISLDIKKGEKIGIVGSNGSGKTTILKIITGITTPNKGTVRTWGKVVSLIDLSAGFHPELNGWENIYQNGLLLGMSRKEVSRKIDQIIDFADIGDFINAPLYTYSSGMKLRLGFSIAVAADPDVLVLDEGVAVGDWDFQQKSRDKIAEFFAKGKTIILVSHWMDYLEKHCQRIVWIENGKIVGDGGLSVLVKYQKNKKS
jgi:ABC-type polysaccharide/polyol phosphate transport system ATPase subunit